MLTCSPAVNEGIERAQARAAMLRAACLQIEGGLLIIAREAGYRSCDAAAHGALLRVAAQLRAEGVVMTGWIG